MNLKTKISDLITSARVGAKVVTANDGKAVEPIVIRYKDLFFEIMLDAETGKPTGDFGWSEGSPITHVPIREFYTAVRGGTFNLKITKGEAATHPNPNNTKEK